jgi:hypothetical protein
MTRLAEEKHQPRHHRAPGRTSLVAKESLLALCGLSRMLSKLAISGSMDWLQAADPGDAFALVRPVSGQFHQPNERGV